MNPTQPDFFTETKLAETLPKSISEGELADFRGYLIGCNGAWRTREEISAALGWEDRKIRAVAQALGGQIIRGQSGYKLTVACTREDIARMTQAADAAGSQARHMREYELSVRKAIHSIVG